MAHRGMFGRRSFLGFNAPHKRAIFPVMRMSVLVPAGVATSPQSFHKSRISDRVLDVLVAEVVLQRPGIHALVGELESG
jgi:hypothetical protein